MVVLCGDSACYCDHLGEAEAVAATDESFEDLGYGKASRSVVNLCSIKARAN